ncbi:MAG: hypothetical protein ACO3JL_00635 [Myxococcota bacterium]
MALILTLPTAAHATDRAERRSAEAAFDALSASAKDARAHWRPGQPGPTVVTGMRVPTEGTNPAARAEHFLRRHEALLGVPSADFSVEEVTPSRYGTSVRLAQRFDKLQVHGREVVVTLDTAGDVISLTSSAAPVALLLPARLDEAGAYGMARKALPGLVVSKESTSVVLPRPDGAAPALSFLASRPEDLRAFRVLVDLNLGTVVGVQEITQR